MVLCNMLAVIGKVTGPQSTTRLSYSHTRIGESGNAVSLANEASLGQEVRLS